MPYKDLKRQREANKEAARRHRVLHKNAVIPDKSVIPSVIPHSVYQYIMSSGGTITPSLLDALVDSKKRPKLEAICNSLGKRNLLGEVYYGISGITFRDVSELLEATA